MKYMLLIHNAIDAKSGPEVLAEYGAFADAAGQAGKLLAGDELASPDTATSVRVRDGERLVTDGPYGETKEFLGGYFVLDCTDLDEAIEWAAKLPGARDGAIEIRPLVDHDEH